MSEPIRDIVMGANAIERRMLNTSELRLDGAGTERTIRGYAAVFDSVSLPLGGFREVIRQGAFKKTLREGDIRAFWNHDSNFVLGRKSARTLQLSEDEKGLSVKIMPPNVSWANDLMESINRGDVTGMSFGFRMIKEQWHTDQNGDSLRELLEVQLQEVSPCTLPAYPQTEVHIRTVMNAVLNRIKLGDTISQEERASMAKALENLRSYLREPGLPHSRSESEEPDAAALAAIHSQDVERRARIRKRLEWLLVG